MFFPRFRYRVRCVQNTVAIPPFPAANPDGYGPRQVDRDGDTMRRIALVQLIAAVTVATIAAPAGAATPTAEPDAEQDSLSLVNAERSSRGKGTLAWDVDLARVARDHSHDMATDGELRHNDRLGEQVDGGWEELGENVGYGASASDIHDGFMGSAVHRDNILGPFDRIGIGAVRDDGGTLWVTQIFMRSGGGGNGGGSGGSDGGSRPRPARRTEAVRVVTYRAASVAAVEGVRAPRARRASRASGLALAMLGRILGDGAGTAKAEPARAPRYS